jgi:hypothetical protein
MSMRADVVNSHRRASAFLALWVNWPRSRLRDPVNLG